MSRPKPNINFDIRLVFLLLAITLIGIVVVASSSTEISMQIFGNSYWFIVRQLTYITVGAVASSIVISTPIELSQKLRFLLLLIAIGSLIVVFAPLISKTVNGSTRWLNFGFISVQPSEFAKVLLILYFAGYLSKNRKTLGERWTQLIQPSLIIGIVSILLLQQPDFGTLMVILFTICGMFFIGGLPMRFIIAVLLAGFLMVVVLVIIEPYRIERLLTVFDPWQNALGSGYQPIQSLIAVGRGGWLGTGLGTSVQKFLYLPEAHTDFPFSVFIEEVGSFGGIILITLFMLLVIRCFRLGQKAINKDMLFHAMVAYGIGILLAIQSIINIGVSLAILPTTGMPLPFISYGGSSIVTYFILAGFLIRIDFETRQKKHSHTKKTFARGSKIQSREAPSWI